MAKLNNKCYNITIIKLKIIMCYRKNVYPLSIYTFTSENLLELMDVLGG